MKTVEYRHWSWIYPRANRNPTETKEAEKPSNMKQISPWRLQFEEILFDFRVDLHSLVSISVHDETEYGVDVSAATENPTYSKLAARVVFIPTSMYQAVLEIVPVSYTRHPGSA
jgi:hypothetical protein